MATEKEYAFLATRTYFRTQANRVKPEDIGWTVLREVPDQPSGFSAGVYKKGNEIVISYTGTNEKKVADTLAANIPAAIGVLSAQVLEATGLYLGACDFGRSLTN